MLALVRYGVGLSLVCDSLAMRESHAHGLVVVEGAALDGAQRPAQTAGMRCRHGAARSSWPASCSSVSSRPNAAPNWMPIGRPLGVSTPSGTDIAGKPVTLKSAM